MRSTATTSEHPAHPHTSARHRAHPRTLPPPPPPDSTLEAALQVLDNSHALTFLQSLPVLSARHQCLRARLAHLLHQHHLCLQFAIHSLQTTPCCTPCLEVYLAHAPKPCAFRPRLMRALGEAGMEMGAEWLLRVAEEGEGRSRYRVLMAELRRQRGRLDKFEVVEMQPNERKVVAKEHISRDELILFVPKNKLITLELSRTLPLVDRLYSMRVHLKSPKHTQLAVFLLHEFEKGEQSPFANYLATLPTDFRRFPINYPPQLLKELQGTSFLQQLQGKQEDLRRDYEVVCGADGGFTRFSYQRFVEARLLVCSRVFGVVVERVKTDAMVPLADMLNHQMPKQTSWYYCDHSQGFVIQSLRDIPAGAEIFDSYGQKCNSRFLLNYGFTLADNPHNEVVALSIKRTLTITSPLHRPAALRLRVSRILESKGFDELMGILRTVVSAQLHQPQTQEVEPFQNAKQTPFSSIEQEVRAWQLLENIVSDRLKEYPTSLSQDRRLLERAEGSLADVIVLRAGEKQVLHFYLTMARKMSKWLGSHSKRSELAAYEVYLSGLELQGRTQE